jgi:hypothetical protein
MLHHGLVPCRSHRSALFALFALFGLFALGSACSSTTPGGDAGVLDVASDVTGTDTAAALDSGAADAPVATDSAPPGLDHGAMDTPLPDVTGVDSPYDTRYANAVGAVLCRQCVILRCDADAAACAADPACVNAASCLATCTNETCTAECVRGDAVLARRANAFALCLARNACIFPCFGVPEPRTTCGALGQICDPLVATIATCCDGQGMCPANGGACCRPVGGACDPSAPSPDAVCCAGDHCDPASSQCVATTCVRAGRGCTMGGMPCCDAGLACVAQSAGVGPQCCGPNGATIAENLPCCSGSSRAAGPGMKMCLAP